MKFSKLLLASAVAMSSCAFAMENMSDESLSDTIGQDGITLKIATPAAGIAFETRVFDTGGFTGATNTGVIVMGGALTGGVKTSLVTPVGQTIDVLVDAGATTAGGVATLNIGVTIPTGTVIHTGTLSVASGTVMGAGLTNQSNAIIDDMTITLGATNLNIQLGNAQPQGSMVKVNTSMTGGLSLANFKLHDLVGLGDIAATNIVMRDTAGGANLTVVADAKVTTAGLVITATQLGTVGGGFDQRITGLQLGTAPAIGNVEVIGLNMNGSSITIAGH